MAANSLIAHWQRRARAELKGAQTLFKSNDPDFYREVLFHCHLAIELALKSRYLAEKESEAPYTHDLNELAHSLRMSWTEDERDRLEDMTDFAILCRYGDERWYVEYATKEKAQQMIKQAEIFLSKIFP